MQTTFHPIFKRDTKGVLRIWFIEQDGPRYRTTAGIDGGSLVTSEWTKAESTNIGRANERDAVAQATFEINAAYEKKLTREYHLTIDATVGGAHFFKPMLAQKYEGFEPGFAQPKLDGIRCIATAQGLFSREGKPINSCPHILAGLAPQFASDPGLILDGELYNHELKDDFNAIVSLVKKQSPTADQLATIAAKVQYHVYDMPSHSGTFKERCDALLPLAQRDDCIQWVVTMRVSEAQRYDDLHGYWLEQGYEGSMWRADKPYEQKRSKTLRKRKEFQDSEFEIVRIEEGLGNWSGMAKRVVCRLPDGREFGAGIKGPMDRAKSLLGETHNVATIQFFALTPDGVPRFPVATKFWGAERTL